MHVQLCDDNSFQDAFRVIAVPAFNAAAANGHVRIVNMLLEAGADVNGTDNEGNSPVHSAVIQYVSPPCYHF